MDYFSWKKCVFFLFNIFYTKCHFHKNSQRNIVMRVSMTGSDEQAFFLTIRCYQSEKCGRKKEVGLPTVFFKLIFYASSCPSVALSMFFWTFCHDCCEVQIWHLYLGSRINCYKQYSKVKVSVASQNNFPTNQQFLLKYLLCLQKQEQGACCQHNQKTFWSLPRNCGEDVILDRLGCKCDATWLVVGGK